MFDAFTTLKRDGFGYVDAGARDGVHAVFADAAPLLEVVGFEPDAEECRRLSAAAHGWRSATYLPWALGARDGEQPFHLCRSRGTSSCYRPNRTWLERFPDPQRYDVVETQTVRVRSLDSLRRDASARLPSSIDFLKLDVQGAELDVLHGAGETLRQVTGIEVEVEFAPLYEGQPLFRDVDAYLEERGFSLFKLRRKSWVRRNRQQHPRISAGQLIAGDALYLRDPLVSNGRGAWTAHQVEALVLTAALYDLNDFALEVLAAPQISSAVDTQAITAAIERRSRSLNGQSWRMMQECFKGLAGLGNLYAWRQRRSWGRADSDKDFYSRVPQR